MVEDLDRAMLHGHSVDEQITSITDKYIELQWANDKQEQELKEKIKQAHD
jgi:hypothetical protein